MTTLASIDGFLKEWRQALDARVARIESAVKDIGRSASRLNHKTPKDHYSTREFAALANLTAYTVREACRTGRLKATKTRSGRGDRKEWRISHAEYLRYQAEGLLGGSDDPK